MAVLDAAFYAAGGASSLALAVALWAASQRRAASRRIRELTEALNERERGGEAAQASAEAFGSAVVMIEHTEDGEAEARLASGPDSLAACAPTLGLTERRLGGAGAGRFARVRSGPRAKARSPDRARRAVRLRSAGGAGAGAASRGAVVVEGRTAGALAWLRLSATVGGGSALGGAVRRLPRRPAEPWRGSRRPAGGCCGPTALGWPPLTQHLWTRRRRGGSPLTAA